MIATGKSSELFAEYAAKGWDNRTSSLWELLVGTPGQFTLSFMAGVHLGNEAQKRHCETGRRFA